LQYSSPFRIVVCSTGQQIALAGMQRAPHNQQPEAFMNWEQVEGKWKQLSGKVQEKWGKLTDSDLQVIKGKRDQLVGKIQERYGIAKEEAQRQVDNYFDTMPADTVEDRDKARGAGR
jgi:uncharacterized protein YjbJ (UPF0337 family)